jgi:hypothetical protein
MTSPNAASLRLSDLPATQLSTSKHRLCRSAARVSGSRGCRQGHCPHSPCRPRRPRISAAQQLLQQPPLRHHLPAMYGFFREGGGSRQVETSIGGNFLQSSNTRNVSGFVSKGLRYAFTAFAVRQSGVLEGPRTVADERGLSCCPTCRSAASGDMLQEHNTGLFRRIAARTRWAGERAVARGVGRAGQTGEKVRHACSSHRMPRELFCCCNVAGTVHAGAAAGGVPAQVLRVPAPSPNRCPRASPEAPFSPRISTAVDGGPPCAGRMLSEAMGRECF